jgi:hypothetical protein
MKNSRTDRPVRGSLNEAQARLWYGCLGVLAIWFAFASGYTIVPLYHPTPWHGHRFRCRLVEVTGKGKPAIEAGGEFGRVKQRQGRSEARPRTPPAQLPKERRYGRRDQVSRQNPRRAL